jgi:ribonuclease D
MPGYKYLDITSDELAGMIAEESLIGLDTEFMREKTFHPQLCLVQVSTRDAICCADPLIPKDDERERQIWSQLLKRSWVVHSARQDVEVIYQTTRQMPTALFDTQIAAALLGYPPQMGYANLVEELFDEKLAKSHTRADWSRRPLADEVIEYAAEDVEYLLPAFDILQERLDKLGRLAWAREDSADLLVESLYQNDPQIAVERLKGARNLRGAARAAAVRLAAWREEKALASDRPRQWIMRDAVLLEIAVARPASKSALASTAGLAERTAQRFADDILSIVAKSGKDQHNYEPPRKPDEAQKALLRDMQSLVASQAEELGLATELVAPKKELSSALAGDRDSRVFRGWRRELVGERLLAMLDGPGNL